MDNDNLCRTCLNRDCKYFQIYDYADENKAIWEMLDGIVPQIHIKDDNIEFSSLICETCVDKLLSSYKFQQLCIDADNQFRQQILFTCEAELKEVTVKPEEDDEPSMEDESRQMKIEIYNFDGMQENASNDDDADTSNDKKISEVAKDKQENPLAEPSKTVEPEKNDDTEINKPLEKLKLAVPFTIVKLNSRKRFCCTVCGKLYDRTSRIEQHLHSKHKYTHEDIKIFFKCFDYNENLIEEYHQEEVTEVNNTSTELAGNNEDFDENTEWLNLLDYVEDSGNISSSHEAEDDKHIEKSWRKTNRHGQRTLNTYKPTKDCKYFQIYDYADENKAIWEMLDGIVPQIHIKDDNIEFSSLICETCVDKLLSSYKFQQLCIDADNQFRQQILFTCEAELKEVTVKPEEDDEPSMEDESRQMKIEIYNFDGMQENASNDDDADTSNDKKISEVAKDRQENPLAEPSKTVEPEKNDDTEINKPLEKLKLAVPFTIVKLNSRKRFCCTVCGKLYDRTSRIEQHLHSKHKYTHEDIKIFFKCFDYNENLIEEYHQEEVTEVNNTSTELAGNNEDFDENTEWLNLLDYVEDSGNISSSHEAEDDKHIEKSWRKTNRHGQRTLNTYKPTKKKYYCTVCGRKFVRMSRLITHRCLHAKRRKFVCNICNCSFANEQIYFNHRKRHKVDEIYLECPESGANLIEENHKEIRARSLEHGENNKDCNESKEWQQQQLSESKKAEAENRTDSKNTVTHDIERTKNRGNGNFPCEVCGKIFNCFSRLKRHSPVHSLDKPYDCEICKRRFSTFHYLKIHKLLHEKNERDGGLSTQNSIGVFKCPDCPKRFGKQSALASHRQVHTRNTANYSCVHCQRNFMSTKTLTDHIKNKHPEEKYTCEQCNKTFFLQERLQRHLRAHKDLGCTICGKEFTSEPTLKEHMNIHSGQNPYLCPECGKNFKYASSLRRHIERHSEVEKYLCPECPKGFKCRSDLNRHIKNHRIKKAQAAQPKILNFEASSFKCHKCKIRFASASYLRSHMRTHNKATATVEF